MNEYRNMIESARKKVDELRSKADEIENAIENIVGGFSRLDNISKNVDILTIEEHKFQQNDHDSEQYVRSNVINILKDCKRPVSIKDMIVMLADRKITIKNHQLQGTLRGLSDIKMVQGKGYELSDVGRARLQEREIAIQAAKKAKKSDSVVVIVAKAAELVEKNGPMMTWDIFEQLRSLGVKVMGKNQRANLDCKLRSSGSFTRKDGRWILSPAYLEKKKAANKKSKAPGEKK